MKNYKITLGNGMSNTFRKLTTVTQMTNKALNIGLSVHIEVIEEDEQEINEFLKSINEDEETVGMVGNDKEILRIILQIITAIMAALGVVTMSGCTVQHVVRQSSTTTTTRSNGETESISTTIEYDQQGSGKK